MSVKKEKVKNLAINKTGNKFKVISKILSFLCFAIAFAILYRQLFPIVRQEIVYNLDTKSAEDILPVNTEFGLVIPKIKANTKVIKNVNPYEEEVYQLALSRGVAHAHGSSLPNQNGNTFIFAHSAGNWLEANNYNAVFYLLNKMTKDDEMLLYFENKEYKYRVSQIKIVNANEVDYISGDKNKKTLTLMTCWPAGTSLKRLVVIGEMVE